MLRNGSFSRVRVAGVVVRSALLVSATTAQRDRMVTSSHPKGSRDRDLRIAGQRGGLRGGGAYRSHQSICREGKRTHLQISMWTELLPLLAPSALPPHNGADP